MPPEPDDHPIAPSTRPPDARPNARQNGSASRPASLVPEAPPESTDRWTPGQDTLGSAIRLLRKQSGLSLSELAARAGCAKSYLSAIENSKRHGPARDLLTRIESQLGADPGTLTRLADRERAPDSVRDELRAARAQSAMLARLRAVAQEGGLDEAHRAGTIQRMLTELGGSALDPEGGRSAAHGDNPAEEARAAGVSPIASLPFEVPLINKVTAGYPTEFTDLGYPARVADDYVRCPDLSDPDAFAARVVGDSMSPDYREGDIVVFSPLRDIADGDDCFARLSTGDESTFKRVYFEGDPGSERIRLQPINSRYAPRTYDREDVAGLYRAVQVMRAL